MTPAELYSKMMDEHPSIEKALPATYKVDADTYAQVCNFIFVHQYNETSSAIHFPTHNTIRVSIGKKQHGIMFKGVELILCRD